MAPHRSPHPAPLRLAAGPCRTRPRHRGEAVTTRTARFLALAFAAAPLTGLASEFPPRLLAPGGSHGSAIGAFDGPFGGAVDATGQPYGAARADLRPQVFGGNRACIDYRDCLHWVGAVVTSENDQAYGVTVSGKHAYVAHGPSGLLAIDITDPAAPAIVGGVDTPGSAGDVAVSGKYAYVADGSSGLQVIDITDPAAPKIVGGVDTPGSAGDIAISGQYAYVADGPSGLQVIDIRDPAAPAIVGNVDADARGVAVSGHYAYVVDFTLGLLRVIDVTDPVAPVIVGSVEFTWGGPWRVCVAGSYAYVTFNTLRGGTTFGGLEVIDVTDPRAPVSLGYMWLGSYARDVAVSGSNTYASVVSAGGSGLLQAIDVTNPAAPVIVGSVGVAPGEPYGVSVAGSYACVVANSWPYMSTSFQVIDVTHPASAPIVGSVRTPGYVQDVAVSGNHAYVADHSSGLQVIDITDPAAPAIVGGVDTPGTAYQVAVSGQYAYITDVEERGGGYFAGFRVIDITDPSAPAVVGGMDMGVWAGAVAVSGSYAYVTDPGIYGAPGDLRVIDVGDPSAPAIIGSVGTPGNIRDVAVSGNYAYVADGFSGLQVIDIADPAAPAIVGGMDTPGWAGDVTVSGNHAYVGGDSFLVVDISDPVTPKIVSDVGASLGGVAVSGKYAYVFQFLHGLRVLDITNPDAPTILGGADPPFHFAYCVAVSGSYLYVGDHQYLKILPTQCEQATAVLYGGFPAPGVRLVAPAPNPTRGRARIGCALPREAHVTLRIYDVRGRLVDEVAKGLFPAGTHGWEWDGRASAAGIYFVRLEADGVVRVARLALVH